MSENIEEIYPTLARSRERAEQKQNDPPISLASLVGPETITSLVNQVVVGFGKRDTVTFHDDPMNRQCVAADDVLARLVDAKRNNQRVEVTIAKLTGRWRVTEIEECRT